MREQAVLLSFFLFTSSLFLLLSVEGSGADEDVSLKFAQNIGAPTLKILYW